MMLPQSNQRGFTLVGLILTITILSIFGTSFLLVFEFSTRESARKSYILAATRLAQEQVESIVARRKQDGYSAVNSTNFPASESFSAPYNVFTRETTITEVDTEDLITADANSGVKRILVEVSWSNDAEDKVELVTLVGEYN